MKKMFKKEEMTFDELFIGIDEVKKAGDVFILKIDGERDNDTNTVMITFPNSNIEMIRHDGVDIKKAIKDALKDYSSIKK